MLRALVVGRTRTIFLGNLQVQILLNGGGGGGGNPRPPPPPSPPPLAGGGGGGGGKPQPCHRVDSLITFKHETRIKPDHHTEDRGACSMVREGAYLKVFKGRGVFS